MPHADERADIEAYLGRIQMRVAAFDDACLFELANALEHGRRGESGLGAELSEGLSSVVLDRVEEQAINRIEVLHDCETLESYDALRKNVLRSSGLRTAERFVCGSRLWRMFGERMR